MAGRLMIAALLIWQVDAFRLQSRTADTGGAIAESMSVPYPMDVPVLIRSHRHQNLQDSNDQVKLVSGTDAWEHWVISDAGNGKVTIKSHRNRHLQDSAGRVRLSEHTQEWEQWAISSVGNGKVVIKSHRNQYLQDNNGRVMTSPNTHEWEQWSIVIGQPQCKSWCLDEGERYRGQYCSPGDMVHLCGACSFCGGQPPTPSSTPSPTPYPTASPSPGGDTTVNVLGWNVEYRAFQSSWKVQQIADRMSNMPGCPEADIAGLQECMNENSLNDALNGRMTKVPAKTEFNCLFYRPSTIQYVSGAGRVSIPRDRHSVRYVSYAEYSKNGNQFWHFNTHWGHNGAQNHIRSAQAILNKWREMGQPPALITGDFNLHTGAHKHGGGYTELINNGFKEVCTGRMDGMDITFASAAHWDKIRSSDGPSDSSFRNGWSDGRATAPSDHAAYVCTLKLRR